MEIYFVFSFSASVTFSSFVLSIYPVIGIRKVIKMVKNASWNEKVLTAVPGLALINSALLILIARL